ncbi:MAG: winged helix-turn-helix transcriptional regulator [Candidatus Palauibacterales bacterium]|nr:winged helix-turn-helix transcriptional regulator [Candidatus Palauibacterales bacterium]
MNDIDTHMPEELLAPGMTDTRRRLLLRLKRHGAMTLATISEAFDLSPETLRSHLRDLEAEGVVERAGVRRHGRGRPEVIYRLAPAAERLFPQREGEMLGELAAFLVRSGRPDLIHGFFEERMARRRAEALERVEGLEGRARMEEIADILTEEGFMAEVETSADGESELRLCHCPIRELVDVSTVPCKAEIGLIRELLGDLARHSYIPNGEPACSYSLRRRDGARDEPAAEAAG